ncbi:hypothetical protein BD769DRAFT_1655416 [Suillus cothurnatus]|nr:hypothetical protein BD769DRAFT_1655416 [Suillus cothurnatus]
MQTDYACSQDDSIPTSLQVPSQIQEPEFSFDDNFDTAEYTIYDEHIADTTGEPTKQNRTVGLLRLDGRGDFIFDQVCEGHDGCQGHPDYQCRDCFGTALYCKGCMLARHQESPLHRLQHWVDGHFKNTNLKALGLRIQLAHRVGKCCCNPVSTAFHNDFVVLDVNGVHSVAVDFCGCETAQPVTTQLLRVRWFPATSLNPKSAATFQLLHHFHILTFESKASAFECWQTLSRLSDDSGINPPKDCYEALLRMIKEWRNLTLLKRFGCGHDPKGISVTQPGSCAVLCPACPQPGKNLPHGWEDATPEKQWLYGIFIAIDANFRLARKNISSDKVDPGLSNGWSYFVEEKGYKTFLNKVGQQPQEKSTCASHDAVNLAETKNSCGLAATGAGTVDCSRHNFKWPCAVGDLQKGEKYVNMDYLFCSTMQYTKDLIVFNVSYDIACQWSKNIQERMLKYPDHIRFNCADKSMTFLVPKFHLPAHISACQITYSHNLIRGMGRTDGKAPERGWANINPVATSTCEMGPGARHDTLDDHFGNFNWKKVTNMGVSLLRKLKVAMPERERHQHDFHEFNGTLIAERPEEVSQWRIAVEEWEADMSVTNPFGETTATMTQASVRLSLSQKEADDLKHGVDHSLHSEISPTVLISTGIAIEEEQNRLKRDISALGAHSTDLQRSKIQDRTNALKCKIEQWSQVQLLYMPSASRIRTTRDSSAGAFEEKAHNINLFLPSELKEHTPDAVCDEQLCRFEWELHQGQSFDALDDLPNTRASAVIGNIERNVLEAADRYCRARNALKNLHETLGEHDWLEVFPILEQAHIRGMSEGEAGQSEGNRTLSWIWKARGFLLLHDLHALRIEWCKARARANRWTEEVQLLLEEMRRVREFLSWHAAWWDEQADRRVNLLAAEAEGIKGYARRQAALRRRIQHAFTKMWSGFVVSATTATATATETSTSPMLSPV